MSIVYKEEKVFNEKQVEGLFLSVGWVSGKYPQRLYKALLGSSTVVTAWHNEKLVGLARAIDDGEVLAFVHYVLVHPEYQGKGIASVMIKKLIEKYKDYIYIEVMPDESKNATFYEAFGFVKMKDGVAMQICNFN